MQPFLTLCVMFLLLAPRSTCLTGTCACGISPFNRRQSSMNAFSSRWWGGGCAPRLSYPSAKPTWCQNLKLAQFFTSPMSIPLLPGSFSLVPVHSSAGLSTLHLHLPPLPDELVNLSQSKGRKSLSLCVFCKLLLATSATAWQFFLFHPTPCK